MVEKLVSNNSGKGQNLFGHRVTQSYRVFRFISEIVNLVFYAFAGLAKVRVFSSFSGDNYPLTRLQITSRCTGYWMYCPRFLPLMQPLMQGRSHLEKKAEHWPRLVQWRVLPEKSSKRAWRSSQRITEIRSKYSQLGLDKEIWLLSKNLKTMLPCFVTVTLLIAQASADANILVRL